MHVLRIITSSVSGDEKRHATILEKELNLISEHCCINSNEIVSIMYIRSEFIGTNEIRYYNVILR